MTHAKSQDGADRQAEDLWTNLGTDIADLFNVLDKAISREVTPHGITSLEYNLLWHCRERGECTATQLVQVLPVDGSRISRIVAGLVDKGLLRRRRLRNDRRVVMLSLTEDGASLTSRIAQNMHRYYSMLAEGIGKDEMRVFTSVTSRIVANHAAIQDAE